MIIDAHTHVWPDRIAEIALSSSVDKLDNLAARGNGTVGGLVDDMSASGVDMSCCLGIANEARHVDSVNRFVAGLTSDTRFGFGTIHVELSVEENIASLKRHGIRGVKIHPLYQGFALDDPRLWAILEAFGEDFAVITHVGAGGSAEANRLSSPAMIRDIARQFPKLRLMACHFGGYKILDDAEEMLAGADVVLETSWPPSLKTLRPERVRNLIRKHGAERIVFGSDWPMTSPAEEIAAIQALGLNDTETKLVLGGTLARVLGIKSSWS
ncbi:amidohydrolase family protein [Nocardioides dubius]|uniref:Amidohydrolase family protein n=1 Tax=Nocardioides dubius TaxID=317019 RepID=A0ABP4ED12_9ACTN